MWLTWGKGELRTEFWWGNWKEGDYLEGLGVDRRVMLKYILIETGLELDSGDSGYGQVLGCFKCGHEHFVSM